MNYRRILIPTLGFVPSGGNRVLCYLATEYVRMGIAVDFLVLDSETSPPFQTEAKVIYAQSVHPICVADRRGTKLSIIRNILRLARALRLIRKNYDLFLASYSFVALACVLAGGARQTLYYIQSYDPEVLFTKKTLGSLIGAALSYLSYLFCRNQVVNSPHYIGYPGINATEFVPPGVDNSVFFPRPLPPLLGAKTIRIGVIGRSEPHKFRPVVEAFRSIRKFHPDCLLLVAYGNIPVDMLMSAGPYEIVVPGNDIELAAFYRECDVFLALSEFGVGAFYPPLEALASGAYLISNRFLYINERNCWIVDRPEQASSAFNSLLSCTVAERESKRLQGISDVTQMLEWTTVARRLLALATLLVTRQS